MFWLRIHTMISVEEVSESFWEEILMLNVSYRIFWELPGRRYLSLQTIGVSEIFLEFFFVDYGIFWNCSGRCMFHIHFRIVLVFLGDNPYVWCKLQNFPWVIWTETFIFHVNYRLIEVFWSEKFCFWYRLQICLILLEFFFVYIDYRIIGFFRE